MATTLGTSEEPVIPPNTFSTETFGDRLLLLRIFHDMCSVASIAKRCGLDDGSWANWESGTKPRDMETVVRKISAALNVDKNWLMWGTPGCLTGGKEAAGPGGILVSSAA